METNDAQYNFDGKDEMPDADKLAPFKIWFEEAVEASDEWRTLAKEDRDFYAGRQWRDADRDTLEKHGRPAITVNRIKPLINVLSGYQRLNRYDIEFLPRTNDDMDLAQARKGVTKYILDSSHYNYEESDVFTDGVVCGIGWFEVGYAFDWAKADGDAFVRRVSPFDMYVDPESRDRYFRDAKYIIRARWIDKDELKRVYPEHEDEIVAQTAIYLTEETEGGADNSKLWWQRETKKIRLAECWYKKNVKRKVYILRSGKTVMTVTPEMVALQAVVDVKEFTATEIHLMAFFDNVVLEDKKSPYEHGEFPFIPFTCYYQGDDDVPAGVVRDLKDPQREINKRRSQELHILNTQSNNNWLVEEGAMTKIQLAKFEENASTPGKIIQVGAGALTGNRMRELGSKAAPNNVVQATQEAMQELPQISGINEALMGTDVSNLASGRAIELKQKQAITHIALLFDNLRYAKERIAFLLWGSRGAKGIVPQFYTEEKTFRIVGEQGNMEFITVNQQVQQRDPRTMTTITKVLNDLSVGEFDIVISDTPATATQRTAQFWSLVDACGKLGIQGNMVLDILIDLSDIPQKEEIKRRLQQQNQQQMQAQQMQLQAQLAMEKEKRFSKSVAYKDLPLPLQLELAAKAGIFPQQYADAFLQWSVQQYAQAMGIPQQVQAAYPYQQQLMQQPQAQAQVQGQASGAIPPALQQQLMQQQLAQQQSQGAPPTAQQPSQQPVTQSAIDGMINAATPVL